jgi:hypothetical protein
VSLFAGKHLNVAVLTDFAAGIKKNIDRLKGSKLLSDGRVMTATEFVEKPEADIEDFFEPELWCKIVNSTYGLSGVQQLKPEQFKPEANGTSKRVLHVTQEHFNLLPADTAEFDHFAPAAWLVENSTVLDQKDQPTDRSLDRFQAIFDRLKKLLP